MRLMTILFGMLLLTTFTTASGQTLYRCQDGKKVTYSDRPCVGGVEKRVSSDDSPTAEERAAARARLQQQIEVQASRDAVTREREAAVAQAAAERRATRSEGPPPDPRDNEKVMVHGPTGWDYKTRGQLKAEAAARAGDPVRPTGAAWEGESVTTHGSSGWNSAPRLDAARAEGQKQRRNDQAAERARAEQQSPFIQDQHGKNWLRQGGTAFDPASGRRCVVAGNVLVSCN
jgi:hypothetical protein